MLSHLSIRDLAVVETLSVEFGDQLTVLTGETGAGKSILVDAMSLVLGARATAQIVRAGAERAEVTALFDIANLSTVRNRLNRLELDDGEAELHLRRTVSADGRSRAYVNGRPVPVQTLRDIGATLVEIHGQHEHHNLLDAAVQRELLDAFGGHSKPAGAVRKAHERYVELVRERDSLSGEGGDAEARRALLDYQVAELDELAPQVDEFETVRAALGRLSRSEIHRESCSTAQALLDADDGAQAQLERARALVEAMAPDSPAAEEVTGLLATAGIHLQEALVGLRDINDSISDDPAHRAELETRLDALHNVARKHRVEPEALGALHTELRTELQRLDGAAGRLTELAALIDEARAAYSTSAAALTKVRKRAATKFGKQVTANMSELGMPGGRCLVAVDLESVPDHGLGRTRAAGDDRIEFRFSANPGHEPASLRKVASGGELSRISLSIQVILAGGSGVPTLVFDEVDVGIGGGVAEIVGKRLREVASDRQVLCVTHLAQVACQGHGHLLVEKRATRGATHSVLTHLKDDARVGEVARMLGGVEITDRTLAHAQEMLELAAAQP
jgi:DNA repair protein RecN (Recombination protein N)